MSLKNKENQILSFILILGTLLLYAPTLFFQFLAYDDNEYVFENIPILSGLSADFFKWFLTANVSANWHPLTLLSHALDCQFFGMWAGGHHLTSVVFHTANALLVFILFLHMTDSAKKSFLIAAFFAWHPVKVESVAWVAERKDVLSTFFALLSMIRYVLYVKIDRPKNNFILCLLFFILSLLCKTMYVTLPLILLLFDFWPLERKDKKFLSLLFEKIPFFILSALFCIVTIKAQSLGGGIHSFADASFLTRCANIAQVYWDYIFLFLWPSKLSIFYPYIPNAHVIQSLFIGAGLTLFALFLFLNRKKHPSLWMGWCLFGITLFPVSGIVTIGAHWMACRYLYWPSVGLSILLVWGFPFLLSKARFIQRTWLILSLCLLAALAIRTSVFLSYWQNSYKLFQHAIETVPHNWLAHINLRATYGRDGNHEKAAEHFIEAIKILPAVTNRLSLHWMDFYYMGAANWHQGKRLPAESFLREAARRLKETPPKDILPSSQTKRDHLAACLAAFDAKNPDACPL